MVKGIRKHMGTRYGIVKYRYSHYFVRLEEGKPATDYATNTETYENRAREYIERLRNRKIHLSI
jgi:large subunit ribosomal protein L22